MGRGPGGGGRQEPQGPGRGRARRGAPRRKPGAGPGAGREPICGAPATPRDRRPTREDGPSSPRDPNRERTMDVEPGIIEGLYGRPWPWRHRQGAGTLLAPHGYRFYLYAPKADPYLRRRWQEPHPEHAAEGLTRLAERCRAEEVRFGIGLSPYEIYRDFGDAAREALSRKLAFFDGLGV